MVTGEFYTKKEHFPGFGRPFVFNAEILLKFVEIFPQYFQSNSVNVFECSLAVFCLLSCRVGRKNEAKNAARGALKSPWWTLGCKYKVWLLQAAFGSSIIVGMFCGKIEGNS